MKKRRWFRERFTFLVIRNADQSAKQFQISKPLLLAVPITAVIAVASLLWSINGLTTYKEELTRQVEELEYILVDKDVDIHDKQSSIETLQNEILELSSQAGDMQERLEQISELERQLEELISNFTGRSNTTSVQALTDDSSSETAYEIVNDPMQAGGLYIPLDEKMAVSLAEETKLTLSQMSEDLTLHIASIAEIMAEAAEVQNMIEHTPNYWPTKSTRITSGFGYRKDPFTRRTAFHSGIDFGAVHGDAVYAAGAGTVTEVGFNRSEGNYIIVNHGYGLKSKYMHLSGTLVKKNDEVAKGDTIGKAGRTGRSTGVHLHFEIFKNGVQVDPLPYISKTK